MCRPQKFVSIILLACIYLPALSQDLAAISKSKPFEWHAGIQVGSYFSQSNRSTPLSSPFGYYINSNISLSVKGFSLPFSFSFRNQQFNYTHPTIRLGLSPYYKWAKLYIGHNQIQYSPYTLDGMTFNGGGFLITPGKFRLGVMAGELQSPRAILDSIQGNLHFINSYKRFAKGVKIGFGTDDSHFDLIFFNAKDKSKLALIPDSVRIKQAENTTVGFQARLGFWNHKIQFEVNSAASAFTNDINSSPLSTDAKTEKYLKAGNKIMSINNSTRLSVAGDASLSLNLGNFRIGGRFQHIDPGYSSMGAYFFRDDNENLTLNSGFILFKGKLQLDGSYGLQQNNVRDQRSLKSSQIIYNGNINITPTNWGGINIQYFNFNMNQQSGLIQINDSLRFGQINSNTNITPYLSFSNKIFSHNISLSYSSQQVKDLSFEESLGQNAVITSTNLSYSLNNKINGYNINSSLQYLNTDQAFSQNSRYGIYLTGSKRLLKNKLNIRLQINYSKNTLEAKPDGNQYGGSSGIIIKMGKHSNFSFQLNYNDRNAALGRSYNEWRGNTSLNIQLK